MRVDANLAAARRSAVRKKSLARYRRRASRGIAATFLRTHQPGFARFLRQFARQGDGHGGQGVAPGAAIGREQKNQPSAAM